MKQSNNPYIYYNQNNSRNQIKSNNNTVINLVNIIYDNEFVSMLNDLSSSVKDCFKLFIKLLNNIKDISSTISSQTLYSKCLIKDYIITNKKNKNEKLLQVMDRLDIIDNNKNLLDNNISFMNVNITTFLGHAKTLFKKMKITRKIKLNNIQNFKSVNSRCSNNINNPDIMINKFNSEYNSYGNSRTKNIKNKRNYSSYDNMRYQEKNPNTVHNSSFSKRNKSLKNICESFFINSSNNLNNNCLENTNDVSERQKTISFNLRSFIFNKDKNKIKNILENNESIKKEEKINNNNLLLNYRSLIDNSRTKNNRKKINKGNIQYLKNINSFKNDNRINNFFNSNIIEKNNKKINYNYMSNDNKINQIINKNIEIDNNILATKIIEYFTLIKNSERNKTKLENIKKYLINICLNIIKNNEGNSINIINQNNNRINSLKHNCIKNTKMSEDMYKNLNLNLKNKNNIMRNPDNNNKIRFYNSVENSKRVEKKEENIKNIINILKQEINKKNEFIKKLKNNKNNNIYGIIKAQNFEIIQKRKIIILIKKEISITYIGNKIKNNLIENNNKNYKYKYELIQEEMNKKKDEIIKLNNKIEELNKQNNSLLNKLDTLNSSKNNLEQEKSNLLLKIKKLEDFNSNQNKKIIITNTDEENIENISDIIEEQSSENEREKNLLEENNKLQEKINILQSELNKVILNENDKSRKLSRNNGNNEYENCVEFNSINDIKKEKNNSKNNNNNNYNELKIKEDLIEKLQKKLNEYEKNKKNIFYNKKDDYIILCDKNYQELKWFLITKKNLINNLNYENTIWVNINQVDEDIIKDSKLLKNSEDENIVINYLRKLEEKENLISKLQLKIKNYEKNNNIDNKNPKMRSKSSNNNKINEEIDVFDLDNL